MKEKLFFLRTFLKNPTAVSSVIPTSEPALREIASDIDGSVRRVIVEYGPGTGGLARILLEPGKLTDDSLLILIEKTRQLADYLVQEITGPRVRVFHDSAENVQEILEQCGETQADYVLCSAPLTIMPRDVRQRIMQHTHDVLAPEGVFIVYLFRKKIVRYLKECFPDVTYRIIENSIPRDLILCHAKKAPHDHRDVGSG